MHKQLIDSINQKIRPHLYQSVSVGYVFKLPKVLNIPEDIANKDEKLKSRINKSSVVVVSHISEKGLFLSPINIIDTVEFCSWESMNPESIEFSAQFINQTI